MAAFSSHDFLDALIAYLAANAVGGAIEYSNTPRAIWRYRAAEKDATDPYSVVAPFGGELPWVPSATLAVQVMTTGKVASAAHARAQAIFGALLDGDGRPKRMVDLNDTYRLIGVLALRPPQAIGLDENERTQVAFNFDARAANVAA